MTEPSILQIGTSRFLQAHVDLFAQEAADAGQPAVEIVVVQTTDDPARAARLPGFSDPAGFPVMLRGIEHGATVDRTIRVRSVVAGMALHAQWAAIVDIFCGRTTHVVSNTADTGYAITPADRSAAILDGGAPASFPAILLALLHRRWGRGGAGVTMLPCELVPRNGDTLRALVLGLAGEIGADPAFRAWLADECRWANTLVDRIVSEPIEPVGAVAEPYALWAVERQPGLVMPFTHPAVVLTGDLEPFERLKLHILNLGHSWLAEQWWQGGADPQATVRGMLAEPGTGAAMRALLADEVVPGLAAHGLAEQASTYVERTLERFANPFLDHRIADIHVNHAAKLAKRVGGFLQWLDASGADLPLPRLRALAAVYRTTS